MGVYVSNTPALPAAASRAPHAPVFDYAPSGRTMSNYAVRGAPDYGIGYMAGHGSAGVWIPEDVSAPVTLTNVEATDVLATPPGSMDGRGEACFWLGNTTRANGLYGRNARIGIWTGSACRGTIIANALIDVSKQPGSVAWYAEHETDWLMLYRSHLIADGNAINAEWWYGGLGSRRLIIEDCVIESRHGWCIFLDAGTYGCVVRRTTLKGLNGIATPQVLAVTGEPNLIDWPSLTLSLSGQTWLEHDHPMGALAAHPLAARRARPIYGVQPEMQSAAFAYHAARRAS